MDLNFTKMQDMLRKSVAEFLAKECPYEMVKELEESESGYSPLKVLIFVIYPTAFVSVKDKKQSPCKTSPPPRFNGRLIRRSAGTNSRQPPFHQKHNRI